MSLTSIADNLWSATQPLRFIGLAITTRMTIVRLSSNELILISPIALEDTDCQQLNALGTVRHIIAPNLFHYMFLDKAQAIYPEATVWGVEGLAEKCPNLKLDALVNQPGSFDNELDYLPFKRFATIMPPQGIAMANETVFLHRSSRTLILTDTAFNFDKNSSLSIRLGTRLLGGYNKLQPTRLEKGTRDKVSLAGSVRQILAWNFDRVIPGHGSIVETNGKAAFKQGYEWFLGYSL
ncbi:MAG: DUF4336 domain-containing protein [Cyanobacteria bacterium P01_D01_bin.156]